MFRKCRKFIAGILTCSVGGEEGPPGEVMFKLRPSGWREIALVKKQKFQVEDMTLHIAGSKDTDCRDVEA